MKILTLLAIGLFALPCWSKEAASKLPLDAVVFDPKVWDRDLEAIRDGGTKSDVVMDPAVMEAFRQEGFAVAPDPPAGLDWLSAEKSGLRARPQRCSLLDRDLGEVVIRGEEGKTADISISIYNRGDDGDVSMTRFEGIANEWKTALEGKLGIEGEERDGKGAVATSGWMWRVGDSAFLLESSVNRSEKRPEFIRLRIASISAAKHRSNSVAKRSSLDDNVRTDDKGFVFLEGLPMVDQGQKGYCVVATVERVARYFGLDTDQHEMAQLADTSEAGTSGDGMQRAFQRITGKLHVRTLKLIDYDERQLGKDIRSYNREAKAANKATFDYDPKEWMIHPAMFWAEADPVTFRTVKAKQNGFDHFNRKVKEYVDQGIPLCWTLYLGMFKEGKLPQMSGGHMRLIIGYNDEDPEVPLVYYTDSWGQGHERKTMRADEAYCMTMALYAMVPNR